MWTERLLGLFLLYGPVAAFSAVFWLWPIRKIVKIWDGRDFMDSMRPERRHVAHTERLLKVVP